MGSRASWSRTKGDFSGSRTWKSAAVFLVPVLVILCLLAGERLIPQAPTSTTHLPEEAPAAGVSPSPFLPSGGGGEGFVQKGGKVFPPRSSHDPHSHPGGDGKQLRDNNHNDDEVPLTTAQKTSTFPAAPQNKSEVPTVKCLVLSCYYRSPSFYHGRETPSYKWILVFIRSFFQVTARESCGLLLFVDVDSQRHLEEKLSAEVQQRVRFVTIQANSTIQPMGYLKTEKWATGLKNSANNFRFALIRDWLDIRIKASKKEEEQTAGINLKAESRRLAADAVPTFEHHDEALLPTLPKSSISTDSKFMITDFKITAATRVLVSDVTDVAFQYSPFTEASCFYVADHHRGHKAADAGGVTPDRTEHHYYDVGTHRGGKAGKVRFTLEHQSKTFKTEVYNKRWMNCIEGGQVTKRFAKSSSPISCAGVTAGTAQGIQTYARLQIDMLSVPESLQCSITDVKAALDQATHNYLLHSGVLKAEGVQVEASPHSWHCTFHGNFGKLKLASRKEVQTTLKAKEEDGSSGRGGGGAPSYLDLAPEQAEFVVSNLGVPYAVVHQYTSDRHPAVMKLMEKLYLRTTS